MAENAELVHANAARNRFENVQAMTVAVGASSGARTLLPAGHPGSATLSTAEPPPDLAGRREVTVAAIDDLSRAGTIRPPSLVKADFEGGEVEVLEGMARTLAAVRPVVIVELDDRTATGLVRKRGQADDFFSTAGYATRLPEPSYRYERWHVLHVEARPAVVPSRVE